MRSIVLYVAADVQGRSLNTPLAHTYVDRVIYNPCACIDTPERRQCLLQFL
jgi:hypothetical protein